MGKGILRVDADIVAEWFVAGKVRDDAKALLKLPGHYEVDDVTMDDTGQHVCLTVSSSDIPEISEGVGIPEIEAELSKTGDEHGKWHLPESYKLVGLKAVVALPIDSPDPSLGSVIDASNV